METQIRLSDICTEGEGTGTAKTAVKQENKGAEIPSGRVYTTPWGSSLTPGSSRPREVPTGRVTHSSAPPQPPGHSPPGSPARNAGAAGTALVFADVLPKTRQRRPRSRSAGPGAWGRGGSHAGGACEAPASHSAKRRGASPPSTLERACQGPCGPQHGGGCARAWAGVSPPHLCTVL